MITHLSKILLISGLVIVMAAKSFALAPSSVNSAPSLESFGNITLSYKNTRTNIDSFLKLLKKQTNETEIFNEVALLLRDMIRSNSIQTIGFPTTCIGCAAISGYIFSNLGYDIYWMNITDNNYLAPEAHVALLIHKPNSNHFYIFDEALKLIQEVHFKDSQNAALSRNNQNLLFDFIVKDKNSSLVESSTPENVAAWIKDNDLPKIRQQAAQNALNGQISPSFKIHPRGQIMNFERGYHFALMSCFAHQLVQSNNIGNINEAIKIHEQIKIFNPNDFLNIAALAKAYARKNKFDLTAYELFKTADQLSANHPMVNEYYGEYYGRKGNPGFAITYLKNAFRDNPRSIENAFNLGMAHFERKNYVESLKLFRFCYELAYAAKNTQFMNFVNDHINKIPETVKSQNDHPVSNRYSLTELYTSA